MQKQPKKNTQSVKKKKKQGGVCPDWGSISDVGRDAGKIGSAIFNC
jgi:hypothetical protein